LVLNNNIGILGNWNKWKLVHR